MFRRAHGRSKLPEAQASEGTPILSGAERIATKPHLSQATYRIATSFTPFVLNDSRKSEIAAILIKSIAEHADKRRHAAADYRHDGSRWPAKLAPFFAATDRKGQQAVAVADSHRSAGLA